MEGMGIGCGVNGCISGNERDIVIQDHPGRHVIDGGMERWCAGAGIVEQHILCCSTFRLGRRVWFELAGKKQGLLLAQRRVLRGTSKGDSLRREEGDLIDRSPCWSKSRQIDRWEARPTSTLQEYPTKPENAYAKEHPANDATHEP